jgi:Spy/CpxP family protein refolding chaperone
MHMKRLMAFLFVGFLVFLSLWSGSCAGSPVNKNQSEPVFDEEEMIPPMPPGAASGFGIDPPPAPAMPGRGWHGRGEAPGLGLDEKQKEAIQTIRSKTDREFIRQRADLRMAELDLRDLLGKDSVDLKEAEKVLKRISTLKAEMELSRIRSFEEIKSNLTPEQRKKLREARIMPPPRLGSFMAGPPRPMMPGSLPCAVPGQ